MLLEEPKMAGSASYAIPTITSGIAVLLPLVASTRTSTQVTSARITGAPRICRPQRSLYSKHAYACDSRVAGPVILRSRIDPSERKTPEIGRKYYRPFSRRSLSGAAFRAMTGRTVNPQVVGSSPTRGANIHAGLGRLAVRVGNISLPSWVIFLLRPFASQSQHQSRR